MVVITPLPLGEGLGEGLVVVYLLLNKSFIPSMSNDKEKRRV